MYVGDRFDSYRGYKFDFVGTPDEPPALKTHAYGSGASLDSMSSVFAVSWNGATEVVSWTFYGSNNPSTPFQNLGTIAKFGFETTYISNRFWAFSYAQANAANGTSLGFSRVEEIILPNRQTNNIKLAGLSTDARRTERRSAVATIVTIVIVLVGLALGGLTLILLFVWKRPNSCYLPAYMPVRNMDGYAEAGEMEALKYNDGSDSETGTESSNGHYAEEGQRAVPTAKFSLESVYDGVGNRKGPVPQLPSAEP
jgi:hypothetical protein